MSSKVTRIVSSENRDQVSELYQHLEHVTMGDKYLAWYGQCRAAKMSHEEAIRATISYWSIASTEWYASRLARAVEKGQPLRDFVSKTD